MLLLLTIALISTLAFYRRGKQVGISPGRAASYPFVALGLFLVFSHLTSHLIVMLINANEPSKTTVMAIGFGFNLLVVLAYLKFISRNWQVLNQSNRSV